MINLSTLNIFVPHHHFKVEDLKVVAGILRPFDFMCKIDLKDAYFAVPIHPAPKGSLLSVQECNLPVQMPTLRSHFSTSGLHKSAEAPDSLCQETGSEDLHLHRQHANPKFSDGESLKRCVSNDLPVGKSGVPCEYGQIYSSPFTGNGIPRCIGQLHAHEFLSHREQSIESPEECKRLLSSRSAS